MRKYTWSIILALWLLGSPAWAVTPSVGVICTTANECDQFRFHLSNQSYRDIAGRRFIAGAIQTQPVVMVESPMGKIENTITAMLLVQEYGPTAIYSLGTAGTLMQALLPGDILVSNSIVQHDAGSRTDVGFVPYEKASAIIQLTQEDYPGSTKLDAVRVFHGRLASGDQFIESTTEADRIKTQFDAHAVDTSSAGIHVVCQHFNIECLSVRLITDSASPKARRQYDRALQQPRSAAVNYLIELLASK